MIGISHPEGLTVTKEGKPFFGYSQEWYHTKHQRRAGCGPTVGAMIIAYEEMKLKGHNISTCKDAVILMDQIWHYITPRIGGLYKTKWMEEGLNRYFSDYHRRMKAEKLSVPICCFSRPSFCDVKCFIKEGLLQDFPIAFLNLHRGGECIPYNWHWMPIVAMEEKQGQTIITLWDEGTEWHFSLEKWLKKTFWGGGFVRISPKK